MTSYRQPQIVRKKTFRALLLIGALCLLTLVGWKVALWHQLSQFRRLTYSMKAEDVIALCGRPVKTSGSGFLFLHYRLLDGSEVVVTCASELRVVSVAREGQWLFKAQQ